jgi:hypothetical protein
VQDPAFFLKLAPGFSIGAGTSFGSKARNMKSNFNSIGPCGYTYFKSIVPQRAVNAMQLAIEALESEKLPAVFAFVYDAFWEPLDALVSSAGKVLGPYEALSDVWAWYISENIGNSGWPAHRGHSHYEISADGMPIMLNIWIALTDCSSDEACIWIVPLTDDPNYPNHLERSDGINRAICLPVQSGDALAWNANALHWGGKMTERARGPRVSFSYTLRTLEAPRIAETLPPVLTFENRLDLIADMIITYRENHSLDKEIKEWAIINRVLRASLQGKPL